MNMKAAGAYLRALRERRGYSRAALASMVDTTETSLYRIEEQGQEPRAGLLAALLHALDGSWIDFRGLILTESATEQDGEAAARIVNDLTDDEIALIRQFNPQQRAAVFRLLREVFAESDDTDAA